MHNIIMNNIVGRKKLSKNAVFSEIKNRAKDLHFENYTDK